MINVQVVDRAEKVRQLEAPPLLKGGLVPWKGILLSSAPTKTMINGCNIAVFLFLVMMVIGTAAVMLVVLWRVLHKI